MKASSIFVLLWSASLEVDRHPVNILYAYVIHTYEYIYIYICIYMQLQQYYILFHDREHIQPFNQTQTLLGHSWDHLGATWLDEAPFTLS